jgi:predicted Rossmann fold flavoprotein
MARLIVIGGGAAGFFCAVNAARLHPGLEVFIIEKSSKLLSKVKVSGGGRCNVTHDCRDITVMSNRYPRGKHFVKKLFHQFFTNDTIEWFEQRGVSLKTEPDGRMFPVTDSSQTIIDCLVREANKYKVQLFLNAEVKHIRKEGDSFILTFADGRTLTADTVCVSTGGYPRTEMFGWLQQLGHAVEEPSPSLFTFNLPKHPITKMMGVSVEDVIIKINSSKLQEQGPLLITHWGLSGPAILRLSAWGARELKQKNWNFSIRINWAGIKEQEILEKMESNRRSQASKRLYAKAEFGIPSRLWEFLATEAGIRNETRWADLPAAERNKFIQLLCNYSCDIKGKTTFKEEFVTAGGIALSEVDPQTMMSRKVAGLFFAGEVLDVDGITGGYNFQHAWSSGYVAAKHIMSWTQQ